MSEPIFAELASEAHHLIQHITSRIRHTDTDPATPGAKGTTMSLATIAADVRNDLNTLMQNAGDDYNRVKTAVENKLPEVERIGQLIDNDPLAQIALSELVPAPLRQIAADAVNAILKAFQAAPAPAAPAAEPAEAEPSEPAPV